MLSLLFWSALFLYAGSKIVEWISNKINKK